METEERVCAMEEEAISVRKWRVKSGKERSQIWKKRESEITTAMGLT